MYVCNVYSWEVYIRIRTYVHMSITYSLTHLLSVRVCVMDVDSQLSSRGSVVCLPSLMQCGREEWREGGTD